MLRSKHLTKILFLASTLLILAFSWKNNIIFTDEILFEEASFQMAQTKKFLIPHLGNQVWLEKPPLYFWLTAAIYQISHPTPFSRRVVTLLSALGTVALTYQLAKYFYQKKIAHWTIIILTTTPLFLYFTKTANLDIPATFFITSTIFFYLKSKTQPRWFLVSAITLGLGVLTRSFLALTPIPIILLDQIVSKKRLPFTSLFLAITITLTIALPWHLYAFFKHPFIFQDQYLGFNIQKHLFQQTPGHQATSTIKFIFQVLGKFNPMAFFFLILPFLNKSSFKKGRIFLFWIVASLLPLTLSTTHNSWYAIQALPPIAILASVGFLEVSKKIKGRLKQPAWELVQILALSLIIALPISVFISLSQETQTVTMLRGFINATPKNTPLVDLEYQFIPQSTLFNPRETYTLEYHQLSRLDSLTYIYTDNPAQLFEAQKNLQECCIAETFLEYQQSTILKVKPKLR